MIIREWDQLIVSVATQGRGVAGVAGQKLLKQEILEKNKLFTPIDLHRLRYQLGDL